MNITKVKNWIKETKRVVKGIEDDHFYPVFVSEKLMKLVDISRRKNLRVDKILGNQKETWEVKVGKTKKAIKKR